MASLADQIVRSVRTDTPLKPTCLEVDMQPGFWMFLSYNGPDAEGWVNLKALYILIEYSTVPSQFASLTNVPP